MTDGTKTYGHGTIDARPNGRFRVRLMLKNGKRRSVTFASLEEATRMRDAMLLEMAEADESPTGAVTFGTYGDGWLTARENSGAYRSVANERSAWNVHIAGSDLAAKPLVDVTRRDVKAFAALLSAKKAMKQRGPRNGKPTDRAPTRTNHILSPQSIEHVLKLVRGALAAAVDEELIPTNPSLGVKPPPQRAKVGDGWLYLTEPEIDRLLTCEKILEETRCMYSVAIYSGLRQGELWSLRWGDITLDGPRPEIHVQRSHDGPPKNGKSRHVPLLPPALAALRRLTELQPKRFEAGGLAFPTLAGNRRRKCDDGGWRGRSLGVRRPRPGHRDHAGIARPVRFHDLRHTCASHLLQGTWGRVWTLPEVRDFLGHSSVTQTQRYAHLSPDHLASAAAGTAGPTLVPKSGPGGLNLAKLQGEAVRQEGGKVATIISTTYGPQDQSGTNVGLARALLEAMARGEQADALADQLADEVLNNDIIKLALQVRDGGPHGWRRAIELAAMVVAHGKVTLGQGDGTTGG